MNILNWILRRKVKPLSRRETQVLQYIVEGKTNKEIASILSIAEQTVKTHVYNIYHKIGVQRRTQAAVWAERNRKPMEAK